MEWEVSLFLKDSLEEDHDDIAGVPEILRNLLLFSKLITAYDDVAAHDSS